MTWLNVVHILGAVQGLFLALVLSSKHRNSVPNKLLALLMAFFSLELATPVYHATGLDQSFPQLIGVTYPLPLAYGPIFYLYGKTLSEGGHVFRRSYLLHFLPFAALLIYMMPFFLASGPVKLAFLERPETTVWLARFNALNLVKLGQGFAYLVALVILVTKHQRRVKDNLSSIEGIQLRWLFVVAVSGVVLWVFAFALYLSSGSPTDPTLRANPLERLDDYAVLTIAAFVYVIGYLGLRQREILEGADWGNDIDARSGGPTATTPSLAESQPSDARYARSGLDAETARTYADRLIQLLEQDKVYRRADLTLRELSEELGVSPHNLSQVINTHFDGSFYDVINRYRVADAKVRLSNDRPEKRSVLAIALDAGFNSKSSFNSVFKRFTGMTPTEYRNKPT